MREIGKKGKADTLVTIFTVVVLAIVVITGIYVYADWGSSSGEEVAAGAFEKSIDVVTNFLYAIFDKTLGLEGAEKDTQFLMFLSFALILIIIVGTLDSINIIGEEGSASSKWINFAIGFIVSIIGVRFMPEGLWTSLAQPSSAFVATILVAVPFAALFFVTYKLKSNLARKLLWIFYIVFLSYNIFSGWEGSTSEQNFAWIYFIFAVLAGAMMLFDSTVRNFFFREKSKAEMEYQLGNLDVLKRKEIRAKVERWSGVLSDENASEKDKGIARRELTKLRKEYGQNIGELTA